MQIKDYNAAHLLMLRRDADTGRLDLLTVGKGWYFRITDHIAEYQMPGFWAADGSQEQMRLSQEGFARKEGWAG